MGEPRNHLTPLTREASTILIGGNMALIQLQPGETFSHAHDVVSTTVLVSGDVTLTVDGETIRLTATPAFVPAGAVHVLHNVGSTVATVACGGYGLGGGTS
jgi:quercetin dioxygenase-like cupin family protein